MAPDQQFLPTRIIIHHSLTEDSGTASWGIIRNYHMNDPKHLYRDIGYHAGAELIRGQYEALFGREWIYPGAHCKDNNHDSLGFCFIGNYDGSIPPDELLITGAKVISVWMRFFNIELHHIFGHNYFDPNKTCPGFQFDMIRLKNAVLGLL